MALLEIGAVQAPWRMGTSAELEQHGCEPQPLDGAPDGASFLSELAQGRADEDAQPLVGGDDHTWDATAKPARLVFHAMTLRTETLQVSGINCERCVLRLGKALEGHDGLEAATANLVGQVTLTWDADRTDRDALLAVIATAGFQPVSAG
jgi:copper chaperone CopZ